MRHLRDAENVLKQYFGHSAFRKGQKELIDALLSGRDVLAVMPTGAGKSVCYQVPALMLPGMTLVISPLISLMKDQVQSLVENGVRAAYLNASLTPRQMELVLSRMAHGRYKLIYVAPERLALPTFRAAVAALEVSLLVVDEAHCVSQWGHDFRPSYLSVASFCGSLPVRPPVCACTATATPRVRDDIIRLLSLREPRFVSGSFDRPNLFFEVEHPGQKLIALRRRLDLYADKSGIVYCSSRKKVDALCEALAAERYSVAGYHAGMNTETRRKNQDDFLFDRKRVMIATNAFGMGIDKSNVSFVIHYNIPGDMESYYQEAGRAGRDGSAADCVLLFQKSNLAIQRYFIDNPEENEALTEEEAEALRRNRLEKLRIMEDYANHKGCLRRFLLAYFGENLPRDCGFCSGCIGNRLSADETEPAQKILSCVARLKENADCKTVVAVLKGREDAKAYKGNSAFGLLSDMAESEIENRVAFLCEQRLLKLQNGVLRCTDAAKDVLFRGRHVRRVITDETRGKLSKPKADGVRPADPVLFDRLRALCRQIAEKSSLPAFAVFPDQTLQSMAAVQPCTLRAFSALPGVSSRKLKKYGIVFLKEIRAYQKETNQSD
jgi:ATP-dependent DNA helicase RecQ